MLKREVENRRGVRQRPRANKVNAQVGERADIAGVHVARALGLGAAGDKLNCTGKKISGNIQPVY